MGFCTNKAFRASIMRGCGIKFKENIILNEDVLFVCNYLKHVEKIEFTEVPYQYYRVFKYRGNSQI